MEHLTDQLVFPCGVSRDDLIKGCPGEIAAVAAEGKLLWAIILALVLLMGKYSDQKDEWEMIDEKGKTWLKLTLVFEWLRDALRRIGFKSQRDTSKERLRRRVLERVNTSGEMKKVDIFTARTDFP